MSSNDLRWEIPPRSYMNAQLLSLVEGGATLADAKKVLFSQPQYAASFDDMDIAKYRPHDHSLIASLLYCTIVVPREILNLPQNHDVYRRFDTANIASRFTSLRPAMDSYTLIRCLRNSVAHALFSVTQEHGEFIYRFWTERNPKLDEATINHRELLAFIETVGSPLVNAVVSNAQSSG